MVCNGSGTCGRVHGRNKLHEQHQPVLQRRHQLQHRCDGLQQRHAEGGGRRPAARTWSATAPGPASPAPPASSCTTNRSACKVGVTSCTTGAMTCVDSANDKPVGTACGPGPSCMGNNADAGGHVRRQRRMRDPGDPDCDFGCDTANGVSAEYGGGSDPRQGGYEAAAANAPPRAHGAASHETRGAARAQVQSVRAPLADRRPLGHQHARDSRRREARPAGWRSCSSRSRRCCCFAVIGRPTTTFARLVTAGIALSVVGDVALLWDSNRAFMVGLAAFLLAHVAYVIAFLGVAVWSPHVAIVAVVISRRRCCCCARSGRARPGCTRRRSRTRVVISAMVVSACGDGRRARSAGAVRGRRRGAVLHLGLEPGAEPLPQADPARGVPGAGRLLDRSARHRDRGVRLASEGGRPDAGRSARGWMRAIAASQKRKKRILSSTGFIQPTVMQ